MLYVALIGFLIISVILFTFLKSPDSSKNDFGKPVIKQNSNERDFLNDKNDNNESFVTWVKTQHNILNENFEKSGVFNFKEFEDAIKSVLLYYRAIEKKEDDVDTSESSLENKLTQLHYDFIEEIKNFNFRDTCVKCNVDTDFEPLYFYQVILSRVWKNIIEMDFDPKNKYEWQEFNKKTTTETRLRAQFLENGKEDSETLNEILNETKLAVILYRFIHSCLQKRLNKIKEFENKLKIRYSVESSVLELIIAQTHATLYANYHLLIGALGATGNVNPTLAIAKEFPDFIIQELHTFKNIIKKQNETEE